MDTWECELLWAKEWSGVEWSGGCGFAGASEGRVLVHTVCIHVGETPVVWSVARHIIVGSCRQ